MDPARAALPARYRRFCWTNAGKAWVAISILRLVEEGKLKLSDHLDCWDPDFPNAEVITIDQLLNHTTRDGAQLPRDFARARRVGCWSRWVGPTAPYARRKNI